MATHYFLKLVTSNNNASYLTVLLLTKSNSNGNALLFYEVTFPTLTLITTHAVFLTKFTISDYHIACKIVCKTIVCVATLKKE